MTHNTFDYGDEPAESIPGTPDDAERATPSGDHVSDEERERTMDRAVADAEASGDERDDNLPAPPRTGV